MFEDESVLFDWQVYRHRKAECVVLHLEKVDFEIFQNGEFTSILNTVFRFYLSHLLAVASRVD